MRSVGRDPDASDDVEFLLTDQLGSVRVLTDAVGAVVGSASFAVFGALEAASGAVSAFGFTGAWRDETTGLVYLRARDYDPATGQFLQVDPAVDDTRQPYAYAYNNPLLWTDPTGLDVWGDVGAGMLAFGAGALDGLTGGLSSAILGAVIPGYDCFTQSNPWFAAGSTVGQVVDAVLTVMAFASGVGALAVLAAVAVKTVAKVGLKAAARLAAASIKASVKSAVQNVKSVVAAGAGAAHHGASTLKGLATGSSKVGTKGADDIVRLSTKDSWANPKTLDDHFERHGADFGAKAADDYAAMASEFFQRGGRSGSRPRSPPTALFGCSTPLPTPSGRLPRTV